VPQSSLNHAFQVVVDKPNHVQVFDENKHRIMDGAIGSQLWNSTKTIQLVIQDIHAPVGARFILTKRSKASVVGELTGHLKIEEVGGKTQRGTGVLSLMFTGASPTKVVSVLNTIAQVAKEQDAKKKSQEASQTLDFLYKQLPITKAQLEKAEYQLNNYRAKSGKIDIKLQTQFLLNQLSDLDKKLGELQINKIDMQQRYTIRHPILIALETQIQALTTQHRVLEQHLKSLPASDQIAVNLLRDVDVKKTLYTILLSKIQELQVVKAGTISSLRILADARVPDAPLPRHGLSVYIVSIFIGILLSFLIIFGRRLFSPRIENPYWVERQFNIANLAIIPYCKEQAAAALGVDSSKRIPLLAFSNPKNLSIESLRSLRTSLQVSLLDASNNIVAILGAAPAVGKSFIAANLAYLLATTGKRVLLVDADLRKGTLHKYMNLSSSPGVADVLNHKVSMEAAIKSTMQENLFCLPRGLYPEDPAELLASSDFKVLMDTLSQKFDIVIVDTAPILLVTDAVLVGRMAATNYIVFGAGAHQPTEVERALKSLKGATVQLNGSIFNFHRAQSKKTGYDYYYNYSYYYDASK